MVVENSVRLGREMVGHRPQSRRQPVIVGTAIGVDRFQPQVARQPTVARGFAYAAERARDHRVQSRRSAEVVIPVSRGPDVRNDAASQNQRHGPKSGPPHGDHCEPSLKSRRIVARVHYTRTVVVVYDRI